MADKTGSTEPTNPTTVTEPPSEMIDGQPREATPAIESRTGGLSHVNVAAASGVATYDEKARRMKEILATGEKKDIFIPVFDDAGPLVVQVNGVKLTLQKNQSYSIPSPFYDVILEHIKVSAAAKEREMRSNKGRP